MLLELTTASNTVEILLEKIGKFGWAFRQDIEKPVHAFITSKLNYWNGLFAGHPKKALRQLQLVQNAAARGLSKNNLNSLHQFSNSCIGCWYVRGLISKYCSSSINH